LCFLPKKIRKQLIENTTIGSGELSSTSDANSDLSSIASDYKVEIKVSKRQRENDKEYLKYVRIQMWWNFIGRILLGVYELVLALMIVYAPLLHKIPFINFSFSCDVDHSGYMTIIRPSK